MENAVALVVTQFPYVIVLTIFRKKRFPAAVTAIHMERLCNFLHGLLFPPGELCS